MTPSRAARVVRVFAFPVALFGVVACAAVLGIDERSPYEDKEDASTRPDAPIGSEGGPDADAATSDDGDIDIDTSINPGFARICVAASCGAAGGTCKNDACVFDCAAGKCTGPTFTCPAGNDCQLECGATTCDGLKCVSERSCTFNCPIKTSCKGGIACEAERCEFFCTGDSCKVIPPKCDASVCIGHCEGPNSCKEGLDFNASTYCGITCSGKASCSTDHAVVQCRAPDASIVCANVMDTCKDSQPTCFGSPAATCTIQCGSTSCVKEACCDGGTCVITPAGVTNTCRPP